VHDSLFGNGFRRGSVELARARRQAMKKDNGSFGLIIGGIVALAAVMFIYSGGTLGGKKIVEGDQDLPPIASSDQDK
jgi:hypothetical protein